MRITAKGEAAAHFPRNAEHSYCTELLEIILCDTAESGGVDFNRYSLFCGCGEKALICIVGNNLI